MHSVKTENALKFLSESLVKLSTDTQKIADDFAAHSRKALRNKTYFRFNVEQGLQDIGLEEHKKVGDIQSNTRAYLAEQKVKFEVEDCVESMKLKQSVLIPDYS
jgi:hypothetical protein